MEDPHRERLAFIRAGENGMTVELVGRIDTLRHMIRATLIDNADIRQLIMPVIVDLMHDKDFMMSMLDDTLSHMTKGDDEDDTIELD